MARCCRAAGWRVVGLAHRGHGATGVRALDPEARDVGLDLGEANAVVLCLPRPSDVSELLEHHSHSLPALVIDTSTGSPAASRALQERLAAVGVRYVDAPVSGSPQQAERGELTVMVGASSGRDRVLDAFVETIAANGCYFERTGAGHEAKLINQVLHLGIVGLIGDALDTARDLGLDLSAVLRVLKTSSGGSRMLDRFGDSIVSGDFEPHFTLELACKDLRLADELRPRTETGPSYLPLTRTLYEKALAQGQGAKNFTVVCRRELARR